MCSYSRDIFLLLNRIEKGGDLLNRRTSVKPRKASHSEKKPLAALAVLQTGTTERAEHRKSTYRDTEYKVTTIRQKVSHSSLCSSDYREEI